MLPLPPLLNPNNDRILLNETVGKLAQVGRDVHGKGKKRSVFVSHPWPAHPMEENLIELIVSFYDVLQLGGLDVRSAILSWVQEDMDKQLSYADFAAKQIKDADAVVYVGCPSFKTEYDRDGSCTALDKQAIAAAGKDPLPVVLVGGFGDSLPPSLTHVLASVCSSPSSQCELLPNVVATLLGITDNPKAQELLAAHDTKTKTLITSLEDATLSKDDIASVKASFNEETQRLELRAFVLKSNLTRAQRRVLDNGLKQQVGAIGHVAKTRMQKQQQQQKEGEGTTKDVLVHNTARHRPKPATSTPETHKQQQQQQQQGENAGQGEQQSSDLTLSAEYTAFMTGSRAVLLVVGQQDVLAHAEQLLVQRQWQYFDAHSTMIPLVVDLDAVENPTSRVVEQALFLTHGYTPQEIEALREGHPGLVIFFKNWRAEQHSTNIYVQNELDRWGSLHGSAPKVVFLVDDGEVASVLPPISPQPAAAATAATAQQTTLAASAAACTADDDSAADPWKLPDVLHPRLLGADIEGPIVLYFLPCDMGREPQPTAFEMVRLKGIAATDCPALAGEKFSEAKAATATVAGDNKNAAAAAAAAAGGGGGGGGGGAKGEEAEAVDLDAIRKRCLESIDQVSTWRGGGV